MAITKVELDNFTAFRKLRLDASPGINVLIGANATGKTHLMKVAYSACDVIGTETLFHDKLIRVFLPSGRQLGRLVQRPSEGVQCKAQVHEGRCPTPVRTKFRSDPAQPGRRFPLPDYGDVPKVSSTYVPVKEMLAHAPHFLSLYDDREIHFEEVYRDIVQRAFRPPLRETSDGQRQLLSLLQDRMGGAVETKGEEFFLRTNDGAFEFSLVAEGMRKLALLWILIRNGSLDPGSILFWDEPETNLNPNMIGTVMEVLLELQRMGVQVFFATHDYVVLKELDLRTEPNDHVLYHALYRDDDGDVQVESTDDYVLINPNAIADTFADLYDRDVERALGRPSE